MKLTKFGEDVILYLADMKAGSFDQLKQLFANKMKHEVFYWRLRRLRLAGLIESFRMTGEKYKWGIWYALPKAADAVGDIDKYVKGYYIPGRPDLKNLEHDIGVNDIRLKFEDTFKGKFIWNSERYLRSQWWIREKERKKANPKHKMKFPKYIADGWVVFKEGHPFAGKVVRIEYENTIKSRTRYKGLLKYFNDVCKEQRIIMVCNDKDKGGLEKSIAKIVKENDWNIDNLCVSTANNILEDLWKMISG